MYKKLIFIFALILITFLLGSKTLYAKQLLINENYVVMENKNKIDIYKDNMLLNSMSDVKILDLRDDKLLYNKNDNVYLYDIDNKNTILVSQKAYNAMFYMENIIFESDLNDNYICRDLMNFKNRNCYKLYLYNIDGYGKSLLNLNGGDIYLNDTDGEFLVYTSNHYHDELCLSVCSYLNVYNVNDNSNIRLDKYVDVDLTISGNGQIDNNIVYFESALDIYDCSHTQIFAYDIFDNSLEIITYDGTTCFKSNNELVDVKDGFVLFATRHNNYENAKYINNIYSYKDNLYDVVSNNCKYVYEAIIINSEVNCIINSQVYKYPIDDLFPYINKDKKYMILKSEIKDIRDKLEISDNLTKKESINVEVLSIKDTLGEQYITIRLCDRVNNCINEDILIEIIDKDVEAPVIYCKDAIRIKINSFFDINDYGYGNDEIDGVLSLKIDDVDVSKKGITRRIVTCEDRSGNVSYKEIEIIIYEDWNVYLLYGIFISISSLLIIIIYIFRFKKGV